ncbi:MAG TPA: lysylphosphatidylglycerol synthase transmembrane domain-containing protein, partial [Solirubrobacteraceae bacterium]|nr:lysylphosphatidylglycerol synthase transmembrane domain-containing protein [Solirubrobacteraceae bacterium]
VTAYQRPRSRRRAIVRLVLTLALFAAVVFAVDQLVPGAGHRLAQANPGWLVGALGLELAACLAYVLLFQTVFSRSPWRLRVRRGAQIALGELGAFAITPTGLGGPAVRVWGLHAGGMPWRTLIVRSISHGAIFNVPYVIAAAVLGAGVSLHLFSGHAPVLTALAPLALVLGVCTLAGAATWFAQTGSPGRESRLRHRVRSALALVPEGIADLAVVARDPRPLLGAIGWWAADCAALWAAFQAVGGHPALSVLILAYMLGQLGNTLPLPGGIGGVEPLMLGIFASSGVNLGLAGAAVICYRAIALGVQGTLGAAAFVSLGSDLRQERAPAPHSVPDAHG